MNKLGRRPPKNARALMLGPLLTGVVPAHPAAVDYLSRLTDWKMLGNDAYGDCVAVTWANNRRLVTAALGDREAYPTVAQVLSLYRTQNPHFPTEDNGMDEQTCLEYLASTGGPDGVKAVAFAKVDVSNKEEIDAAIAIFGSIWTGVQVLDANMDEFDVGAPWDYVVGSPTAGGHAMLGGGYTGASSVDAITWGAETSLTEAFIAHELEEAWVVIWPEHLGSKAFLEGVDLAALAAAYQALTGRVLPVPVPPAPTPDPTPPPPAPAPETVDELLADAVREWANHHHRAATKKVAEAIKAWLAAKGL